MKFYHRFIRADRFKGICTLFLVAVSGIPSLGYAMHLPLWEAGIGAGAVHAPHYRGSTASKNYWAPLPYMVYRGEKIAADRDGFRGKLFESELVRLNISIAGNVPVPSDTGSAREGMPGLDPVLELGPSLNFRLWRNSENDTYLFFKIPLRATISVGDPIMDYQGMVFSPYMQFLKYLHFPSSRWRIKLSTGPIFATKRYHDYFYEVDGKYATSERQEYHSSGGYSGSRVTLTISRNSKRSYLGGFARYDNLSGAIFEDSPLVETDDYLVYGVFFAWVFANSTDHARHHTEDTD